IAEPFEQSECHGGVVHKCAMSSRARDLPADDDGTIRGVETCLAQHVPRAGPLRDLEHRLDRRSVGVLADQVSLGARSANKEDRVDQQRLTGAGLAGQHVESTVELELDRVHHGEVPDSKLAQHPPNATAAVTTVSTRIRSETVLSLAPLQFGPQHTEE